MKHLNTVLSVLLALPYVVFGINHFLHFLPNPPMEGQTAVYAGVLSDSGYMTLIKVFEIVLGLMILVNFYRPLSLILMAPITLNIFFFELFISHQPAIGVVLTILNGFLIYRYRAHFLPMLEKDVTPIR